MATSATTSVTPPRVEPVPFDPTGEWPTEPAPFPERPVAAEPLPVPVALAPGMPARARAEADAPRVVRALRGVPFGLWKRVAAYPLLGIAIFNTMLCGGLSFGTNAALFVAGAVGLAGLAAHLTDSNG